MVFLHDTSRHTVSNHSTSSGFLRLLVTKFLVIIRIGIEAVLAMLPTPSFGWDQLAQDANGSYDTNLLRIFGLSGAENASILPLFSSERLSIFNKFCFNEVTVYSVLTALHLSSHCCFFLLKQNQTQCVYHCRRWCCMCKISMWYWPIIRHDAV